MSNIQCRSENHVFIDNGDLKKQTQFLKGSNECKVNYNKGIRWKKRI